MFERNGSTRFLGVWMLALAVAACGGDGTDQQTEAPSGDADVAPVAVENPATISGVINFTGTPPANDPIDMSEEPSCAEQHPEGPRQQTVLATDGRLKNVFVRITEGLPAGPSGGAPSEPVVIDQEGCVYHPHVVGVVTGQGVVFENSDGLLHNIKATPSNNRPFNISQPTNMQSAPQRFNSPEVMIPIECNVHGWMRAYVGVVDHPYFAVSGDDGTFTIANLPAGTYTIETWHERFGTQTQQVTVGPNETADVSFAYDASMAGAHVPLGEPFDPHGDHGADARIASAH